MLCVNPEKILCFCVYMVVGMPVRRLWFGGFHWKSGGGGYRGERTMYQCANLNNMIFICFTDFDAFTMYRLRNWPSVTKVAYAFWIQKPHKFVWVRGFWGGSVALLETTIFFDRPNPLLLILFFNTLYFLSKKMDLHLEIVGFQYLWKGVC